MVLLLPLDDAASEWNAWNFWGHHSTRDELVWEHSQPSWDGGAMRWNESVSLTAWLHGGGACATSGLLVLWSNTFISLLSLKICYRLNVFASPVTPIPGAIKLIFGNPNALHNDNRRWGHWGWLGHEGGALMNGINDLIKETLESSLALSIMWGHSEKSSQPRRGPSPEPRHAGTLIDL